MENVKPYIKEDLRRFTRHRNLEEKLGEFVDCVKSDWKTDLQNSAAKFVVVGIAEDIGVRANLGRAGASTAFKPALESFLNQQNNAFIDPSSIFILGEIVVDDLMNEAANLDQKKS